MSALNEQIISVSVTDEHILRLAGCKPTEAIIELIWNALDAGALNVKISVKRNAIEGIESISIKDDGVGITEKTLAATFGNLGTSEKTKHSTNKWGERVHGKLGEGRFRAYALGFDISWITTTDSKAFKIISGTRSKAKQFLVKNCEEKTPFSGTGTLFQAVNASSEVSIPNDSVLAEMLQSVFAPKLLAKEQIKISIGEIVLSPKTQVQHDSSENLKSDPLAKVRTVVWKKGNTHQLLWCDAEFNVRAEDDLDLGLATSSYSIFLSSDKIAKAAESGTLDIRESTDLRKLRAEAEDVASKTIVQVRDDKLRRSIEELRASEIYPYKGEPKTELEKAERTVFDVCASHIIQHIPSVAKSPINAKKLTFSLLKHTLETSPPELQRVLSEVLNLSEDDVRDLASFLERSTLSSLIKMGRTITDRLDVLAGLEKIAYDSEYAKVTKERAHLHKLIEDETWIFGDRFSLTASDESLDTVLKKHLSSLGKTVGEQETESKKLKTIPDLVLGRQATTGAGDTFENLVIELKGPNVTLGLEEKSQIEGYAMKIAQEKRFDKDKTKWFFYLVSSKIDADLSRFIEGKQDPVPGRVYFGNNVQIFIYSWGQILQEAKGRMNFLKKKLDIKSNSLAGLKYFSDKFPEIMSDIENRKTVELASKSKKAKKSD